MSLFSRAATEPADERELREGRVRAARACTTWEEITPAERFDRSWPATVRLDD